MAKNNTELLEAIEATDQPKAGPTIAEILERQKAEIGRALPNGMDADTFTRIALTTMKTSDVLAGCTPASYIQCLMLCAQLGFEPGPLGYVWFIPRNVKVNRNGREFKESQVTLVVGYQGWVDLARRSGQIARVECRPVYEGDEFSFCYGTEQHLRHVPSNQPVGLLGSEYNYKSKSRESRNPLAKTPTHVYAYVKLTNGEDAFHVMTWADVLEYRAFGKTRGVWDEHPIPMALKTVFLRLKTWLPRSITMDQAYLHDNTTPASITPNMLEAPRPADPEVVDETPAEISATAESAPEQIDPRAKIAE